MWTEWDGVWDFPDEDADTLVEVVLRNGEYMEGCVDEFIWNQYGSEMDIVKYRAVTESN